MAKTKTLVKSHVELDGDSRIQMIELLNQHLADAFDLFSQVKQAHWNVKGLNFIAIHELFDAVAHEVLEAVDAIAERATALGGAAQGTARMAVQNSRLEEIADGPIQSEDALKMVVERVGKFANDARAAIDTATEAEDTVTADLFTEIVRELDKQIYFLDSHLN